MMNRRQFLGSAAVAGMAARLEARPAGGPWKMSMYQGSLRKSDPSVFELAKRVGLDGVELLMGGLKDNLQVRQPAVRLQYKQAAKAQGLVVSSICINILNNVALKSEPKAAIWLLDTIAACRDFGCKNILVPFFGKGELNMENKEEMERVVDVLKELGPRADAAEVTLGLENTLSAEENMALLEKISAPGVAVYYDVGNSFNKGRDPAAEIRKLNKRICQIHLKDKALLGQGPIDFNAVAAAIRDIDYRGWLVLETGAPSGDLEKDTAANVQFVHKLFGF
jgi:sugar phosphate isomerase/epimerase